MLASPCPVVLHEWWPATQRSASAASQLKISPQHWPRQFQDRRLGLLGHGTSHNVARTEFCQLRHPPQRSSPASNHPGPALTPLRKVLKPKHRPHIPLGRLPGRKTGSANVAWMIGFLVQPWLFNSALSLLRILSLPEGVYFSKGS